jgi:hypothetical protein
MSNSAAIFPKLVTVRWYRYTHVHIVCSVSNELVRYQTAASHKVEESGALDSSHYGHDPVAIVGVV